MDMLAYKVKWNIAEIRTLLCLRSGLDNKSQSQFSDLNPESKDSSRGQPWLCSWTSVDWLPVCLVPQFANLWTHKLQKHCKSQADNCKIFSFLTLPGNEIWFQERAKQQSRDRQDRCEDKFSPVSRNWPVPPKGASQQRKKNPFWKPELPKGTKSPLYFCRRSHPYCAISEGETLRRAEGRKAEKEPAVIGWGGAPRGATFEFGFEKIRSYRFRQKTGERLFPAEEIICSET